jgi:hypothetical protein
VRVSVVVCMSALDSEFVTSPPYLQVSPSTCAVFSFVHLCVYRLFCFSTTCCFFEKWGGGYPLATRSSMASDHTNDDILICYHLSFVLCVVIRSSSVSAGGGAHLALFFFVFTPFGSTSSAVCVVSIRSGQRIVQVGYLSFSLGSLSLSLSSSISVVHSRSLTII